MSKVTLVRGADLSPAQVKQVKSAFVFRLTLENGYPDKNPTGARVPAISDKQWIEEHAFYIKKDGSLASVPGFAEPVYMADDPILAANANAFQVLDKEGSQVQEATIPAKVDITSTNLSGVKSATDMLNVIAQHLNDDLQEFGYDLAVEVVEWKQDRATWRQVRNKASGQAISQRAQNITEIGAVLNALRTFVRIPRRDE